MLQTPRKNQFIIPTRMENTHIFEITKQYKVQTILPAIPKHLHHSLPPQRIPAANSSRDKIPSPLVSNWQITLKGSTHKLSKRSFRYKNCSHNIENQPKNDEVSEVLLFKLFTPEAAVMFQCSCSSWWS